MDRLTYERITAKKEFSDLPKKDLELVFSKFDNSHFSEEEKIKLSRDLLRKIFSGFTSRKLLNLRERNEEWVLKKHLSTRERFSHYNKIYSRILTNSPPSLTIFDLGSGVNGFSFKFFQQLKKKAKYVGVEAIGQLVNLTNEYFKKNKFKGIAIHQSLFNLAEIQKLIQKEKGYKFILMFKVIDSLENLEKNYSKKFLSEIAPFADRFVISFATKSMIRRAKFFAERKWITDFIQEKFKILDDFKISGERYIVFEKKL